MMRAREVADWLHSALLEYQNSELESPVESFDDDRWRPLPSSIALQEGLQPFGEIVGALHRALREAEYSAELSTAKLPDGQFWTIGSRTNVFPIREMYRGFVEPVLRRPIIPRLPDTVVAYLIAISGDRDVLKRERHNQVGWHYHYLNYKKERSNLVLCWDTHAVRQTGVDHPLFQETHGEGHAVFPARPDLWGVTKKKSIHIACAPDLDRWPLHTFRCASAKAGPVWPLFAERTQTVSVGSNASKNKDRGKSGGSKKK
ncbi:hypothetical protein [Bradyrhizobium sp. sGM-13]|uniref:hypothetical protein n=1 Tax=Bradyrhizobium sp. sGM-13 TaxID=2831781 RepID=UPI001BD08CBD|nr:hypothetical protein [Bradyrhizobium sp. sGM-13]